MDGKQVICVGDGINFSVTVQTLTSLRVPPVGCQMVLLAHRYVFVFQDEARDMVKGMGA